MNEDDVQAQIRIDTSKRGWRLWRNNVGVLKNKHGVPVRFGLANDSAAANARHKSADLIGIMPVTIGTEHVGRVMGVFVSIEVKASDWKPSKSSKREQAQIRWRDLVRSLGGYAIISTGELEL